MLSDVSKFIGLSVDFRQFKSIRASLGGSKSRGFTDVKEAARAYDASALENGCKNINFPKNKLDQLAHAAAAKGKEPTAIVPRPAKDVAPEHTSLKRKAVGEGSGSAVENVLADILANYSSKKLGLPKDSLRECSSAVAGDLLSSPMARLGCPSAESARGYLFGLVAFLPRKGSEMAATARSLLGKRSGNTMVYDFKAVVLSQALSALYDEAHA